MSPPGPRDAPDEPPAAASVLIVDDYAPSLTAMEAALEPTGVRVVRASSGEEALACMHREDFAVVLLDVRMPGGLGGLELAERVRAETPVGQRVPIILLTAGESDALEGYAHGAVDFLRKPIHPEVLRAKVEVFVELFHARAQLARQAALLAERERTASRGRTASEARHAASLEAALDAVVGMDHAGRVTEFNPAAERMFGYARGDVMGRPMAELLVPPAHRAAHDRGLARYLATGEARVLGRRVELTAMRADGGEFPIELAISRIATDGPPAFVGYLRDITERRAAEAALREANRLKDEFLSMVSHELRTPLTAILGWAHLLRTGKTTTVDRALETIERNAKIQAKIVEDILDVARVITGKLHLELRRVDLAGVIRAALDTVRPAADARQIHVECALDPGAGEVTGDPDRLQQVVWNLLSNAIKFTPQGGRVTVRLARRAGLAEIRVTDTGEGIAKEFLPHVFERFRQAESTATRAHGGLGLGLALVRHLVELHGGTVDVASAGRGKGATFTVALPARAAAASTDQAAAATATAAGGATGRRAGSPPVTTDTVRIGGGAPSSPPPSAPPPSCLDGVSVLVVDDEGDTRELVREVLEGHGARVTTAGSAREALEALEAGVPDVLVSDIGMPEEDGYALIRAVRARGVRAPAVALTAYARSEDRERVLAAGFQVHAAKPIEPDSLTAIVARVAQAGAIGSSTQNVEP